MDLGIILSVVGLVLAILLVPPRQARDAVAGWLRPLTRRPAPSRAHLADLAGLSDVEVGNQFLTRPLGRDQLTARYDPEWVEYPEAVRPLLADLLDREKARARGEGRTFDNNLGYSLRRIEVARPQAVDGRRENAYTLVVSPSDYEHFVVPNTVLDRPVLDTRTQERELLRDLLGLRADVLALETLDRLPYHFRLGTGTLVETSDKHWVISVRSPRQFMAPDVNPDCLRLHVSAAEGMLRGATPRGGDTTNGQPDPFHTVVRALRDELNLDAGRDYDAAEIGCVGYYLDRSRAQPFLAFLVRAASLSVSSVFERWTETPVDRHENYAILAVEASARSAARLLRGVPLSRDWVRCPAIHDRWMWDGGPRRAVLASNHARTVLAAAAAASCGLRSLIAELEATLPGT